MKLLLYPIQPKMVKNNPITLRQGGNMSRLWKAKGLILLAAGISFVLSIYLWFSGQKDEGLFVGLWVPSILSSGALLLAGRGKNNE
jgi:hypothetical protein